MPLSKERGYFFQTNLGGENPLVERPRTKCPRKWRALRARPTEDEMSEGVPRPPDEAPTQRASIFNPL